jgi:hypothetical protein
MSTHAHLTRTLSLAAIVASEAADLMATAKRVMEHSDGLIGDHLGQATRFDPFELRRLTARIDGQRGLVSGLSENALVAVRLASKELRAALAKARSLPTLEGGLTAEQQSAGRLLAGLAELEGAIRSSQMQMQEVSDSVSQLAGRAEQGRVFEGLMGRLLRRKAR